MVEIELIKQSQAETEFAKKVRLENRMLPEIKSVFSQMVVDYVSRLVATGTIPRAAEFTDEWRATLRRQYRRVGKVFLGTRRGSKFYEIILETKQTLTLEQNAALVAGYSIWSRDFGIQQSAFITQTNQRQYGDALQTATGQAEEQREETGVTLGAAAIAALAGLELRKLFRARETAIANVQTQAPAEEAKRREAIAVGGTEGRTEDVIKKTWQTVGDEKVRLSHVTTNGQRRPGNTAFTVGGENLRYPGDSTLGASLRNTVNCRCAAIWD